MRITSLALLVALPAFGQVDPADETPAPEAPAPETPAPETPAPETPAPETPAPETPAPETAADPEADARLLNAILAVEAALSAKTSAVDAIQRLAALGDERAVPRLDRLSRSSKRENRLAALSGLVRYAHLPAARARLEATLRTDAPPEEAAIALPGLLKANAASGVAPIPCPTTGCVDDKLLLDAVLAVDLSQDLESHLLAIEGLGALKDPRAFGLLHRASRARNDEIRHGALRALVQLDEPRARKRVILALDRPEDAVVAARALAELDDETATDALVRARDGASAGELRDTLNEALKTRAPDRLAAIVEEERRAAEAEANKPDAFDAAPRITVTAVAGLGAAYGGAAASSLVADIAIGRGEGALYGTYGFIVGAGSAAAIAWFSLGDQKLTPPDAGLAVSGAAWGAWAGALTPTTIAGAGIDGRHNVYSAAIGHLAGLTAATAAALYVEPDTSDLVELNAAVVAANGLVLGTVLQFEGDDVRGLTGSLIGATAGGVIAGALAAPHVNLKQDDGAFISASTYAGLWTGVALGSALSVAAPGTTRHLGTTVLGTSLGMAASTAIAGLGYAPGTSGALWETYATTGGGLVGAGVGLLIEDGLQLNTSLAPGLLSAAGALVGAGSVALLPEGIEQDSADIFGNALMTSFALYHATALVAASGGNGRQIAGATLAIPTTVSLALAGAAPFIDGSVGDVFMIAGGMGAGAWFSAMTLASLAERGQRLDASTWILATSLAMDAGLLLGLGLNFLDVEHLGWKVTYVLAVAAATTLVLALPGTLLAAGTDAVTTPDVLLGSSVVGLGIGALTMGLIDFRIAPDLGLGDKSEPLGSKGRGSHSAGLSVEPAVLTLPRVAGLDDQPMALGLTGKF